MFRTIAILVWLALLVGGGCTQIEDRPAAMAQAGVEPVLHEQTRAELRRLGELLDRGEVLYAELAFQRLAGRVPPGNEILVEHQAELKRQLLEQDVEVKEGYLWARRPPTHGLDWRKMLARAQEYRDMQALAGYTAGLAVLRICLEIPDAEQSIGIGCREVHSFGIRGGRSHSTWANVADGGFVLVGKAYHSGVVFGGLNIEVLRHVTAQLALEIPEDKVICAGELLLRAAPDRTLGQIRVRAVPEPGLSLEGAVVQAGRSFARWEGGHPLGPDGSCMIQAVAAGPCQLNVAAGEELRGPPQKLTVEAGQTSQVTLQVYARRRVTIDWQYRFPRGKRTWRKGTTEVLSGGLAPSSMWGYGYPLYRVGHWDGRNTDIRAMNGQMVPVEPGDFDPPTLTVPESDFQSSQGHAYPLAVGQVFAIRYGGTRPGSGGEALIRIRAIEPVIPLATRPADAQ